MEDNDTLEPGYGLAHSGTYMYNIHNFGAKLYLFPERVTYTVLLLILEERVSFFADSMSTVFWAIITLCIVLACKQKYKRKCMMPRPSPQVNDIQWLLG